MITVQGRLDVLCRHSFAVLQARPAPKFIPHLRIVPKYPSGAVPRIANNWTISARRQGCENFCPYSADAGGANTRVPRERSPWQACSAATGLRCASHASSLRGCCRTFLRHLTILHSLLTHGYIHTLLRGSRPTPSTSNLLGRIDALLASFPHQQLIRHTWLCLLLTVQTTAVYQRIGADQKGGKDAPGFVQGMTSCTAGC